MGADPLQQGLFKPSGHGNVKIKAPGLQADLWAVQSYGCRGSCLNNVNQHLASAVRLRSNRQHNAEVGSSPTEVIFSCWVAMLLIWGRKVWVFPRARGKPRFS